MTASKRSRSRPRPLVRVLRILAVVGVFVALAGYALGELTTHRFVVGPGQVVFERVSMPIRKLGRPTSYVVEFGRPVECRVSTTGAEAPGVHVSVVETGHNAFKMWAKLRITTSPSAAPGRRTRTLDFAIDERGGWPQQTIVIDVRPGG